MGFLKNLFKKAVGKPCKEGNHLGKGLRTCSGVCKEKICDNCWVMPEDNPFKLKFCVKCPYQVEEEKEGIPSKVHDHQPQSAAQAAW